MSKGATSSASIQLIVLVCSFMSLHDVMGQLDDWIDPYDMLNYDASTKTTRKQPEAIAVTFITEHMEHVGHGISDFLIALLEDLPVILQIPVFLTIVITIVVLLLGAFQYGIMESSSDAEHPLSGSPYTDSQVEEDSNQEETDEEVPVDGTSNVMGNLQVKQPEAKGKSSSSQVKTTKSSVGKTKPSQGEGAGEGVAATSQPTSKQDERLTGSPPSQGNGAQGTIPLHGEMEEHPVIDLRSSPHPSLELQDETDLSSCFSGLRIEQAISLPRSRSLTSLIHFPSLENKAGFRAKRSHSLNDVTLLDKTQKITPDIIVVENQESYRFHSTQAGLFQCSVTDLGFKMEAEGDVTYRTVPWHRRLQSQLGKRPAGTLFDIKGSQRSVCQLHFPHCEILSTGAGKFLYVVHVKDDDSFELIKPHMITETHVIIDVTGLSLFGIIKEMLFGPSPVQPSPVHALVSLFYTPPTEDDPSSTLKVLLLPRNVVMRHVVKERREINAEEIYIEVSPCKLIPNQEYTIATSPQDDSIIVLPIKAEFEDDESSYHNYLPTFVMNLEAPFSHVRLSLSNSNSICAWEGYVKLSAAALRKQQVQRTLTLPAEERLFSVRDSFIDSISLPNINSLLDKLFTKEVLTDAERETAAEMQSKKEKARFVIDTVRRKGPEASSTMILILYDLDTCLSTHLGLM